VNDELLSTLVDKSDLPARWSWSTLGEMSEKPQYGWTTKANPEKGKLKLLRTTDITPGFVDWSTVPFCTEEPDDIEKYIIKSGDILISRAGSIGVSYLIDNPKRAVFASYLIRFRPKKDINKKYFYYYLKSTGYWNAIGASKVGIAVPNVNATKLARVPIPVAPPDEQDRIVAEIEKQFSRLDEAVAGLKRIKANLKRYKAAVLKAAVEGKLTEEWRKAHPNVESGAELLKRILAERKKKWEENNPSKKYKEPFAPDTSNLPELPEGWVWASLGQLINEPKYGTSKKCGYKSNGIGVLRIPNIADGRVDASDLKFASFDNNEDQTYRLKDGDILTIRSNGSISLVGKCALVTKAEEKYLYAGYLIRMRPLETVSSKYLILCLSSLLLRRQIEAKAKSTSGVNNINSGELQSLIVPVCGEDEQAEIVRLVDENLSSVAHLEAVLEINLKRAERLRHGILKKAFSGQLLSQREHLYNADEMIDLPMAAEAATPYRSRS